MTWCQAVSSTAMRQVQSSDQGHKINHASKGNLSNVVALAIYIQRMMIPQYLLKYLPSVPHQPIQSDEVQLIGIFSSKFISSGSELLLNYPETFELSSLKDAQGQITWLGDTLSISEEYLVKREYVFDVPPLMKKLKSVQEVLPLTMTLEYARQHQAMMNLNNQTMQAIVDKSDDKSLPSDSQQKLATKPASEVKENKVSSKETDIRK